MRRAAFVPTDDPFVSLLFFKLFKDIWSDEVDKLYVCYNSDIDKKVADYVEKRFKQNPKVIWIYVDHRIGNGEPINRCLNVCGEDLIVLMENDAYVYKKGVLDECFKKIESGEYDAIGSPRGSCSIELYQVSMARFNYPSYKFYPEIVWGQSPYSDVGPHFWPAFFFVKKKDLLRTDRDFGSKNFRAGEYIKELDWTPQNPQSGDTLVWISIQLRARWLRFGYVPQCKLYPEQTRLQDIPSFGWIHVGSLSSGWGGGFLRGWYPDKLDSIGDIMDRETRVAFWTIAANLEDYREIAEFKKPYLDGIERLIEHYGMDRNRINEKIKVFKELLYLK